MGSIIEAIELAKRIDTHTHKNKIKKKKRKRK